MNRKQIITAFILVDLVIVMLLLYNYGYLNANQRDAEAMRVADTATNEALSVPTPTATSASALIADLSPTLLAMFAPLPNEATPTEYQSSDGLIALGRTLWYDPRLSISQQHSCNSCHPLDRYGADGLPRSLGHDGRPVKRNAQSVYNAAFHIAQFWDGRSPTVEEQAKAPIISSAEMGMHNPEQVEAVLRSIPGYMPLFAAAFPGDPNPVVFNNVARALGAFERRLVTPSRFDRFIAGDYTQLTAEEQHGLATFIRVGCVTCHVGVTVGGSMFRKLGEVEAYDTPDLGRFEVTNLDTDRYVFKVQSLRNVAQTAPYLHDGSIATLEEMVRVMGRHQLGKQLTDEEVAAIIVFLHTLTGELPHEYIAQPPLPASGPQTQVALQTQ
jgi:cytochrome c peroxidase